MDFGQQAAMNQPYPNYPNYPGSGSLGQTAPSPPESVSMRLAHTGEAISECQKIVAELESVLGIGGGSKEQDTPQPARASRRNDAAAEHDHQSSRPARGHRERAAIGDDMADQWGRPLGDEHYGKDPKEVDAAKPDVGKPEHRAEPESK